MPTVVFEWKSKVGNLAQAAATQRVDADDAVAVYLGGLYYKFTIGVTNENTTGGNYYGNNDRGQIKLSIYPYATNAKFDSVPCNVVLWDDTDVTINCLFDASKRKEFILIPQQYHSNLTVNMNFSIDDTYFQAKEFGQYNNEAKLGLIFDEPQKSLNEKLFETVFQLNESIEAFKAGTNEDVDQLILDNPDHVVLVSKDRECFVCSRLILSFRSAVFASMFESKNNGQESTGFQEARSKAVILSDVDSQTLKEFLRYIYVNIVDVKLCKDIVEKLIYIAEKYATEELSGYCQYLMETLMTADKAADWFDISQLYSLKPLEDSTVEFLCNNLFTIQKDHSASWDQVRVRHSLLQNVLNRLSQFYIKK